MLEPALAHDPCVVAFSGGRDSSLLLAAAMRVARRRGRPKPRAFTLRYPGIDEVDETAWQEAVIRHLGVEDWERVEIHDELEVVGPVAAAQLQRHGVLFPANAHSVAPMAAAAAGGALVLGVGGDELLMGNRWTHFNHLLAGRRRPERADARRAALALAPWALRARLERNRDDLVGDLPWLRPHANAERRGQHARRRDPVRFSRAIREAVSARGLRVAVETVERVGRDQDVDVVCPLGDPRFAAALIDAGGARGWGGRTATMQAIAGDLLPQATVARKTKANFGRVFFGDRSRAFAESWSGEGVDRRLVDTDALRRVWLAERFDFRSALLFQAAWLHDRAAQRDRPLEAVAA